MRELVRGLFINFCILVTATAVGAHLLDRSALLLGQRRRSLVLSLSAVVAGILLMEYPVRLEEGVLIDLRLVPPVLVAQLGGPVPGLAAAVLLGAYCAFLGGAGGQAGALGLLLAAVVGAVWARRSDLERPALTLAGSLVAFTIGAVTWLLVPGFRQEVMREVWVPFLAIQTAGAGLILLILHERLKAIRHQEEVLTQAELDHLTGLHNFRSMEQVLSTRTTRDCLLLVDVDYFKQVNDIHGHQTGDDVLRQVAQVLRDGVRSDDRVFRYGGEEFVVLLRNCSLQTAGTVAERLRQGVAGLQIVAADGGPIAVTMSGGLVAIEPGTPAASGLELADRLLYRAKGEGRNKICKSELHLTSPTIRSANKKPAV